MLEILISVLAMLVMARSYGKKTYHRNYRLRRVRVSPSLALATLAANTALTAGMSAAAQSTYRCISITATWSEVAQIAQTGGPFTVGYAHSDYSVAEIKEAIESASAIDQGDKIAQERANRLVRIVGVLDAGNEGVSTLNDGRPIKTRLNWLIAIGDIVNMFAYNDGTVAVTGAVVKVTGDMWVKDSV